MPKPTSGSATLTGSFRRISMSLTAKGSPGSGPTFLYQACSQSQVVSIRLFA